MMRGASGDALDALHDRLGTALRAGTQPQAATLGEELFGSVAVLRSEPALRRVLVDASIEQDARSGLTQNVFGPAVGERTLAILTDAVGQRWTAGGDLPEALERLAVRATTYSAGNRGADVSDELFAVARLVESSPDLRSALSDPSRTLADRSGLLLGLLGDRVKDATATLVTQAVASDEGAVTSVLDRYQRLAAAAKDETVAVVRSARELGEADLGRIAEALGRQLSTTVHLHPVVDPSLIGGLRVEIGDEVIDGSVASRLDDVRRALAG